MRTAYRKVEVQRPLREIRYYRCISTTSSTANSEMQPHRTDMSVEADHNLEDERGKGLAQTRI